MYGSCFQELEQEFYFFYWSVRLLIFLDVNPNNHRSINVICITVFKIMYTYVTYCICTTVHEILLTSQCTSLSESDSFSVNIFTYNVIIYGQVIFVTTKHDFSNLLTVSFSKSTYSLSNTHAFLPEKAQQDCHSLFSNQNRKNGI